MMEIGIFGLSATQIGLIVVLLAPLSLQFLALIDIARNEFRGSWKVLWLLVLILLPLVGFILYFSFGKRHKVPRSGACTPPECNVP